MRNNWLLFAATIEAMRYRFTGIGDGMRIEYALSKHFEWYKGDGAYGDGDAFHWDYYNSFVIQPMLEEVSRTAEPLIADKRYRAQFVKSLMRYCELLERMISPDGSYPCMGRSIVYRTGAFHALAHAALSGHLPPSLPPGQVRRALSLALRKMFFSQELFDPSGFLQKGLSGLQPGLAESYINTGSLYLCSTIFLPLGLSPDDAFWTDAEQPTTWEKAWVRCKPSRRPRNWIGNGIKRGEISGLLRKDDDFFISFVYNTNIYILSRGSRFEWRSFAKKHISTLPPVKIKSTA